MKEFRIPVRRSARYYTLGEPSDDIRAVWIVLHGYAQLGATFIKAFKELDNGRNLVVAPEALSRFYTDGFVGEVGATWMTKEDRLAEIEDQRNYLDALYRIVTHPLPEDVIVNVLGFSQGTATVCRWMTHTKYRVDNMLLWAGQFPPDLGDLTPLKKLNCYYVYGTRDPFLTDEGIEKMQQELQRSGLHFNTLTFDGKHHINSETLAQLDKVLAHAAVS